VTTINQTIEAERLLLTDLIDPLDAHGVWAELRQGHPALSPHLCVRRGTVTTQVDILDGCYTAFGGMRLDATTAPDAAARRLAYLCGVPHIPGCPPPRTPTD